MKELKKLKGAKKLSKMEQKVIKGGYDPCIKNGICFIGYVCVDGLCVPDGAWV